MRPDPFSALDQVDPPDQWDDIVDRAAHDTDVRALDDAPRRSALARPRTWIATAAAVALVGGGIALATDGPDEDGVATDPTSTTQPADGGTRIDGDCAFTVADDPLVPALEPGRHQIEPELGILAGTTVPTSARGEVDDLLIEVAVGSDLSMTTDEDGARSSVDGDVGWVEMGRVIDSGSPSPCESVAVAVRMPMRPDDLLSRGEELAIEPYRTRAEPILDAVLAAVTVHDASTEAADPVAIDGPCPFEITPSRWVPDVEAGRSPVEPDLGIHDPAPDRSSWAHGSVDGSVFEVAVGPLLTDKTDERTSPDGDQWISRTEIVPSGTAPCTRVAVSARVTIAREDFESDMAGQGTLLAEATGEAIRIIQLVQQAVVVQGDAVAASSSGPPPHIEGTLDDGSPFEVWEDPGHGLCASLRDVILGCDDVGPVIAPDADPSTPRLGIDECCPPVWFGFLPEDAIDVVLRSATGELLDVEAVVDEGIWAVPVPAEHARDDGFDSDTRVFFLHHDGNEYPAPHVG